MHGLAELHRKLGQILESLLGLSLVLGLTDQEIAALSAKSESSSLLSFRDLVSKSFAEVFLVVDQFVVGQNCLPQTGPGILNDLEVGGTQEELGLQLVVAFVVDTKVLDLVFWDRLTQSILAKQNSLRHLLSVWCRF